MRFSIFSRKLVEQYKTDEPHIVISIRNPNSEKANLPDLNSREDALFLPCADSGRVGFKVSEGHLFNKGQAELIWNFVDKYSNNLDLIVINCESGISRSAGVGAALSKILNGDDADFFKYFIPNRLVYRKMMEVKS